MHEFAENDFRTVLTLDPLLDFWRRQVAPRGSVLPSSASTSPHSTIGFRPSQTKMKIRRPGGRTTCNRTENPS